MSGKLVSATKSLTPPDSVSDVAFHLDVHALSDDRVSTVRSHEIFRSDNLDAASVLQSCQDGILGVGVIEPYLLDTCRVLDAAC